MFPRTAEDVPPLVTSHVLDAYAAYVVANAQQQVPQQAEQQPQRAAGGSAVARANSTTPLSLAEALAPLEIMFGKTALSAVGIALHGTEAIIRYVERRRPEEDEEEEEVNSPSGQASVAEHSEGRAADGLQKGCATATASAMRGRSLYRVGEHTLLSPYYCPCSAYSFQSIRREESYYCKHLLALQLALRLEGTGLRQDSILVREVDPVTFEALVLNELN